LERKVRTANDASQLRLLGGKLEPRGKLGWDFHTFRELEPDSPLLGVINGVHHIDRETTRVEHVCHPNVLDLEGCRFERDPSAASSRSRSGAARGKISPITRASWRAFFRSRIFTP